MVVISDEDDCSAVDPQLFKPAPEGPLLAQGLNVRCALNPDRLYELARYQDALSSLRPRNDSLLFVAIGGIPPELVSEEAQSGIDFGQAEQRDAFFDEILAAPDMQERVADVPLYAAQHLVPSCTKSDGSTARPPRRLVQLAKDFGERGVVGSLCGDDFGPVVGRIIRAAAERLD